jgi:hypothetical protein
LGQDLRDVERPGLAMLTQPEKIKDAYEFIRTWIARLRGGGQVASQSVGSHPRIAEEIPETGRLAGPGAIAENGQSQENRQTGGTHERSTQCFRWPVTNSFARAPAL